MAKYRKKLFVELSKEERDEILDEVFSQIKKVIDVEVNDIRLKDEMILQVRSFPIREYPSVIPNYNSDQWEKENKCWEQREAEKQEEKRLLKIKEEEKKKEIEIQTLRKLMDKYPDIVQSVSEIQYDQ